MTDIYDQATEREEKERELAIAAARRSAPVLPFIGVCHNCQAPTAPSVRFCDSDCLADYEKRKRAEAMR
jgi:hypothetical protein